jgi:tricorn protease-like protein
MPRIAAVLKLRPEQHAKVDALIRHFRFVNTDAIQQLLEQDGIVLTRSSLARYMTRLRKGEGVVAGESDHSIIVILDRKTGVAKTVTSPVSQEVILAAISSLNPPI